MIWLPVRRNVRMEEIEIALDSPRDSLEGRLAHAKASEWFASTLSALSGTTTKEDWEKGDAE